MNENDYNRSNSNALWDYVDFVLIVGIQKKPQVLMSTMIVNIFCDRCTDKEFDHFPLPFTATHCPRCGSTDLRGSGLICND